MIPEVIETIKVALDMPKDRKLTKLVISGFEDTNIISDGYHTFGELYDHRVTLFIALCRLYERYVAPGVFPTKEGRLYDVWRSRLHSDGTGIGGWFILGINKKAGEQITYHLPMVRWCDTDFAETLERAPKFDEHTSADVIHRLNKL